MPSHLIYATLYLEHIEKDGVFACLPVVLIK